ncbi:DUF3472 domain-containing protein, partial [Chitinophaga sp.]
MNAPLKSHRTYGLNSFLENFSFENGHLGRKGYFGNHWIKTNTGEWIELT